MHPLLLLKQSVTHQHSPSAYPLYQNKRELVRTYQVELTEFIKTYYKYTTCWSLVRYTCTVKPQFSYVRRFQGTGMIIV